MSRDERGRRNDSGGYRSPQPPVQPVRVHEYRYELPKSGKMKVKAVVFASDKLMQKIRQDATLKQLYNMTQMPGIYKQAIALPDAHQGYGFCIGGVAALDYEEGGISPGGVGYDINCGVRLVKTGLSFGEVQPRMNELVEEIFRTVPAGVGKGGRLGNLTKSELRELLAVGPSWLVERGYGTEDDLLRTEDGGMMPGDPDTVSDAAMKRGFGQVGSLGAGNHFLEIQRIQEVFDASTAKSFGLNKDEVCVMIHSGSRGLGHQICTDFLREMERSNPELVRSLPDRELIYAPSGSRLAERYFGAMSAACNYAWSNRQAILHFVREAFTKEFPDASVTQLYDVCHNVAKIEEHDIEGKRRRVYVHRKGATRSLPPGHTLVPGPYRDVGQPVLLPGSMGTSSYVLVGVPGALEETFGSTAHGAGRVLSRMGAKRRFRGEQIRDSLASRSILLKAHSWKVVAEEAPLAYKDIDEVALVSEKNNIGRRVVRLVPLGVVKG